MREPAASKSCLLAQLHPPDLAADGFGQLRDELDLTRVLVGGGDPLDVVLDVGGKLVGSFVLGRQDDVRLDDLAAFIVGFRLRR